MTVKLIALDLDRTTLDSSGRISEGNRRALEKAAEKGVSIVIATGRPFSALPDDVFEIKAVRYVLTSNGACITDLKEQKTFYENCLSPETVEKSVEILREMPYVFEGFVKGKAYIEKSFYDEVKRTGKSFRNVDYILNTRNPVEGILDFLLENREHVENINVNLEDTTEKPAVKEILLTIPDATITSSLSHNLEIGGATTSKAGALGEMGKILGIKREEMMAVGDSLNDLAMLKACGIPVAVGNAEEEVKAAAVYIAPDNDHDGVADAVRHFIPGI